MRAFLSVEPAGTIASFEQVGIPMATELVGGIVFYPPPKKPRHVNLQTRERRLLPYGKNRRSSIYAYRLSTQCPHWDSNPEHKDFKSSVSANWTMGAHPA